MMGGRDLTQDQLRTSAVTEGTVRMSIGLEDVDDLMEDVSQALAASSPP
jgi:O-acetylhomoserine/O-acetylserine sulfhydrylase-like pyridoxal-dependent enzyme